MKKTLLLFILAVNFIYSQTNIQCGTIFTKENRISISQKNNRTYSINTPVNIPLKIHIVRNSDGTGGVSEATINNAITDLNAKFSVLDITFYICNTINYIDNSTFYNFTNSEEDALAEPTELLQTINIYFVNTLLSNGENVCGYANPPSSYFGSNQFQNTNRVLIKNSCTNGTVLAHELGHFFSLKHTHDTVDGEELVNGTNCSTSGDSFCDTPADPNLSGVVNSSCIYVGNATDANGDTYNPLTDNLMSYSTTACRSTFTNEQIIAILQSLTNERNYLACNGNYSTQYTCNDVYEPSNQYYQATNYMGITNNFEEYHCLSINDVDWIAEVEVNNHNYYIKVEGVNSSFGAYGVRLETNNGVMSIETFPSIMLTTDTKLFLYDSDNTTILAQDDNSGVDNFSKIVYNTTLSIESEFMKKISIFPNPTKNSLHIQNIPQGLIEIKIFNISGKTILKKKFYQNNIELNLRTYTKGLYLIKIQTSKGYIIKKIIKD